MDTDRGAIRNERTQEMQMLALLQRDQDVAVQLFLSFLADSPSYEQILLISDDRR
jgi:hypothetical protein